MYIILLLATSLILAAGPALAETGFIFDSQGGSGTFISPGDGSISFFHGSDGRMGTILPPPREGGIGFYNFMDPDGRPHSGTILTFPSPPPVTTPALIMTPVQPILPAPPPCDRPRRGPPVGVTGGGSSDPGDSRLRAGIRRTRLYGVPALFRR